MEAGYEDIYSDEPYIEIDHGSDSSPCCYIDLLYVPPHLRGTGAGTKLVNEFLENLPEHKKRVRLKSCALGSGHTMPFWKKFGFEQAYYGETDGGDGDLHEVMVLGVNGEPTPRPEKLTEHNNERSMHEQKEDRDWIEFSSRGNDVEMGM